MWTRARCGSMLRRSVVTSHVVRNPMPLTLYNTLNRKKEIFTPADPNRVTMYVCGPTVYSHPHIGNARPAVVFDVLARVLRQHYPNVVYARNLTDVDDKINAAAQSRGLSIREVSDEFTAAYHADVGALGCLSPTVEPRATEHIPQMIAMIERLIDQGFAYEAEGHVLFNVPAYKEYGGLSRRDRDEMVAGARVEVAPYKKDPADFVLWKPSEPELPGWDSPWGRGRPGWHLECSAMIETHLGETIDIHGGGADLIFPHHENEIAQGTCAHGGKQYCRYWVHNGFVNVNREKMSKSLGNVLLVKDLLAEVPGEAIRLALLSAHYHQPLDWSDDTLSQAKQTLDRWYRAVETLDDAGDVAPQLPQEILDALDDDLNTPKALAAVHGLVKDANKAESAQEKQRIKALLLGAGELLGLLQSEPAEWFATESSDLAVDPAEIERLIDERNAARKSRDFARADAIRDELIEKGISLEDTAEGTVWRAAS